MHALENPVEINQDKKLDKEDIKIALKVGHPVNKFTSTLSKLNL